MTKPKRSDSHTQTQNIYKKLLSACKKYQENYDGDGFTLRIKKICNKADAYYTTMCDIGFWEELDDLDGVEWKFNTGKLVFFPEEAIKSIKERIEDGK